MGKLQNNAGGNQKGSPCSAARGLPGRGLSAGSLLVGRNAGKKPGKSRAGGTLYDATRRPLVYLKGLVLPWVAGLCQGFTQHAGPLGRCARAVRQGLPGQAKVQKVGQQQGFGLRPRGQCAAAVVGFATLLAVSVQGGFAQWVPCAPVRSKDLA